MCGNARPPPREMNPMFFDQVIPWLAQLIGHDDFSRSEYSTFLIPESKLEELCKSVTFNGLQWGTRFQDLKISLYLVDGNEAERTEMANRLRSLVGECLVVDGTFSLLLCLHRCLRREEKLLAQQRAVPPDTSPSCSQTNLVALRGSGVGWQAMQMRQRSNCLVYETRPWNRKVLSVKLVSWRWQRV